MKLTIFAEYMPDKKKHVKIKPWLSKAWDIVIGKLLFPTNNSATNKYIYEK